MRYLAISQVLFLHDLQITLYGGAHGITSIPLLESALIRSAINISGIDMFPTVYDKAAVLACAIIKNHPFVDGNKRTAIYSAVVFLEINEFQVKIKRHYFTKLALRIADDRMNYKEVSSYFKKHTEYLGV